MRWLFFVLPLLLLWCWWFDVAAATDVVVDLAVIFGIGIVAEVVVVSNLYSGSITKYFLLTCCSRILLFDREIKIQCNAET